MAKKQPDNMWGDEDSKDEIAVPYQGLHEKQLVSPLEAHQITEDIKDSLIQLSSSDDYPKAS